MELFYRRMGEGEPLIILHGLYGSSDNWYTIGKRLSELFTVYLPDQRNHGQSPHTGEYNYDLLSSDLYDFMQQNSITRSILIGHSMGGKTALAFGIKYPEMVNKMIIVDISPEAYDIDKNQEINSDHKLILTALKNINLADIRSREQADEKLAKSITSEKVRQFLLKNLKRISTDKFEWSFNIEALYNNIHNIFAGVINDKHQIIPQFPLLFIKGELSNYIQKKDEDAIMHYFPWANIEVIKNSGHWVHAEQPEAFLKTVIDFTR